MPDPATGVVGLVMGAGSSRRLGRPKQTLDLGGRTLLDHVVDDVVRSRLDRVVVVLGGAADEAEAGIGPGRAEIVRNDGYGSGCASSLLAGLDQAGDCAGVMMLLGDMPGVDSAVIDTVLDDVSRTRPWAAITRYTDDIGHPFYFSAAAFEELRSLHGDKAVWKIVDRESHDRVVRVPVDRDRPRDVDTWDDYLAVCAAFGVTATSAQGR